MTNEAQPTHNLLMLSGDNSIARGLDTAFNRLLGRFSRYWQRIDILTPHAPDATSRTLHENVTVHPAPYHRALQPLFIKRKGEALLSQRPYHLVTSHDFGFFYNGIGAWWLLHNKPIPLISEVHHIEGTPFAVNNRERLWRTAAKRYFRVMGQRAAAFRVVNASVGQTLATMGVPQSKIHMLYSLYMDFDIYKPQAIADKRYDVLFVGRLASNKGILLLLDAITQVVQSHPTVTLAIRGDGDLRDTLQRQIAESGIEKNVLFLPRVAKTDDMAKVYQQAKMLVCASTVEGNPRVTIEAMACAIPVISTPVGIMPQVIDDGENGYLFNWDAAELAQKIRLLLDDDSLRATIGEAGQQAVQHFDAETVIRDYAEAYYAIIRAH
ncbi:MAG: glycosyltransferase family 4 protein [Anaerolineae bacterium]|nr:glycosyltransferase family 4 protein [Anaerolineae bacterium]